MAKEEKHIEIKCSNCGYIPLPDKTKSNENWQVFDAKCPKCDEFIKIGTIHDKEQQSSLKKEK